MQSTSGGSRLVFVLAIGQTSAANRSLKLASVVRPPLEITRTVRRAAPVNGLRKYRRNMIARNRFRKELKTLDEHMRRFIAHSPFAIISTHSADGRCDASPRGDAPGFVHVVDDRTLLFPDRFGNKRVDSFRNILETGHIGLLFLVPGFGETLRVNGRAVLIRDEAWLAKQAVLIRD